MSAYADFLASKRRVVADSGRIIDPAELHPYLKPHQRDLTSWALRKGKAAIFADTGLGKTAMSVEWARLTGERTIFLAPLAVGAQTIEEAREHLGVEITYVRDQAEADAAGPLVITNYERLDRFDASAFGAVVLDESSILKAFSGATKKALVAAFADAPWRLACTATPAPNDIEELCNHADFLGVMKPSEMRSTFFIADSRGRFMKYRIKGHAKGAFYRWLSTWAAAVHLPSDLGHDDAGYLLPPLSIDATFVESSYVPDGQLFADRLHGIGEAAKVRRETVQARCEAAAALVLAEPDEPWLIFCGLNDEADLMAKLVDGTQVAGSDSIDAKTERLLAFAHGGVERLVTKVAIAGYGMNFQRCARILFVGLGYSFEDHSEFTIDKNPQAQAIRTHSKGLLFVQLQRDAAAMWQAWADYLVVFRAPGVNPTPVHTDLTQEDWIELARPVWPASGGVEVDQVSSEWADELVSQVWYGIRETDVLGVHDARENDDERHLCPLQLPVIERAVRLWSNPGETVLSPFAGIGSEGVGALRNGRRFAGVELKPAYWRVAKRNLERAAAERNAGTLFEAAS